MHKLVCPSRDIPERFGKTVQFARREHIGRLFVGCKFLAFEVRRDQAPFQRLLRRKKRFAGCWIDHPMHVACAAVCHIVPSLTPIQRKLHDLGKLALQFLRAMTMEIAASHIPKRLHAMNEIQRLAVLMVGGLIERPAGAECRKEMCETTFNFLPRHKAPAYRLKQYALTVAALRVRRLIPRIVHG